MSAAKLKSYLYPSAILLSICLITSALLAYTNQITAPIIEKMALEKENEARLQVVDTAKTFSEAKTVDLDDRTFTYYEAYQDDSSPMAYIFITDGPGYGGAVTVMTGITTEGELTGISILDLSETAGLGMNATKPEFQAQYKTLSAASPVEVVKNPPNGNQIQALTGATVTSRAVTTAVNTAITLFDMVKEG
ncbi:MAG: RnfABCDGE type electron transport complex subunit G [Eubacteriales bacterium]|nr:RnfABCDGE type electron transport complex subunit G [Eubacteriales bacterium]